MTVDTTLQAAMIEGIGEASTWESALQSSSSCEEAVQLENLYKWNAKRMRVNHPCIRDMASFITMWMS